MDSRAVADAARRAVQFTLSSKVSRILARHVPDLGQRAALTWGVALLIVSFRQREGDRIPSMRVAADLALTVATSTAMQGILADGLDSVPLTMVHLCCILEAGSALSAVALGELGGAFVGQVQYAFANTVSELLLRSSSLSVVPLAAAAGLTGLASWNGGIDSSLATAFSQAGLNVAKTLLLQSIPVGLQLPTIAGLLAFVKPLHAKLGFGSAVFSFALYQAGDSIQQAVEANLQPFMAASVCVAASLVVPVDSIKAAASIAAVGSVTDWILGMVQEAADQDPIPALLALLVFCRVLLVAFK